MDKQKLVKKVKAKLIESMAFSRNKWIDKIRDNFVGGALGEYSKIKFALYIGLKDFWSNEVKDLLKNISLYMDEKKVKTKTKFDRKKALTEAIFEASTFQDQVVSAKKEVLKLVENKEKYKKLLTYHLPETSQEITKEMIHKFLPEYKDLVS